MVLKMWLPTPVTLSVCQGKGWELQSQGKVPEVLTDWGWHLTLAQLLSHVRVTPCRLHSGAKREDRTKPASKRASLMFHNVIILIIAWILLSEKYPPQDQQTPEDKHRVHYLTFTASTYWALTLSNTAFSTLLILYLFISTFWDRYYHHHFTD